MVGRILVFMWSSGPLFLAQPMGPLGKGCCGSEAQIDYPPSRGAAIGLAKSPKEFSTALARVIVGFPFEDSGPETHVRSVG